MNEYRYILDRTSKKHYCPQCHQKRFVRYVDQTTGEYLASEFGRCDREENCGYFKDPYNNRYGKQDNSFENVVMPESKPEVNIPVDILQRTLKDYENNTFIQNLLTNVPYPFEKSDIEKVVSLYFLGTINKGVSFPFIDKSGNVKAIQCKYFDNNNHTTATGFVHSILKKHYEGKNKPLPAWLNKYISQDKKISCLFGEHLLKKYPQNPIALVEAPKTAIYGTLYYGMPDNPENFLWLAVYNLSSLTFDKITSLLGRTVYLFPDVSKNGHAFKTWKKKTENFSDKMPDTEFYVSNLLKKNATKEDRAKGLDLADYLINKDWRKFREEKQPESLSYKELERIAFEKIGHNNHLEANEIPYINELIENQIITKAEPLNAYYMAESAPF
jgi:hypothetical protein